MPTLYRARVTAVGSEEDMVRLYRALLRSCDWLQEPEDRPPYTLKELREQVRERSFQECGEGCEFYYGMIAPLVFGQARDDTCRLTLRQKDCGLWTATFAYDGDEPFQPEDWLKLHRACDRTPMLALRACEDYARDKGMVVYSGGMIRESWERMDECWLYLMAQYECGYPPEEAVRHLTRLEEALAMEDSDTTVAQVLRGCADHLRDVADHGADPALLTEMLERCRTERDYQGLFMLQCHVAETDLWETEHNARWLACLEAAETAWLKREA